MLRAILSPSTVPVEYRKNFRNFYLDIAWFGIQSGSAVNFLAVYAARLGATGFQLGLYAAMGAIVSLLLAIPTGHWLQGRSTHKAVFWTSVVFRAFYFLWIPLPWLFGEQGQIWALIVIALVMGIPAVPLSVGFNAMFAESVPGEWRAHVMGIRNIVLSITFMISSLGSGYLLEHIPFPGGYQVLFAIGAAAAMLSSLHLARIRPIRPANEGPAAPLPPARPARGSLVSNLKQLLRLDIWKSPFGRLLVVMLGFHLAQNLALPLFPLYNVNILKLTDSQIGIGTALFYLAVLIASTQLAGLSHRLGHHRLAAIGMLGMSLYPIILSFSHGPAPYFALQVIGGVAWGIVGGAQGNYLLENVPANDRPAHLAWYNLVFNACVLAGSLVGPLFSSFLGLGIALLVIGLLRLLAGLAVWRWG